MKKVIEGYVRMRSLDEIERLLPPVETNITGLLSRGLWDKVKITVEINESPEADRNCDKDWFNETC